MMQVSILCMCVVGSYNLGTVDISDITNSENKRSTAESKIAHEIDEQYEKQINGKNYVDAHADALKVEANISGQSRIGDTVTQNPDGSSQLDMKYSGGSTQSYLISNGAMRNK